MRERGAIVLIASSIIIVAICAIGAAASFVKEGFGAVGAAWMQAAGSVAAIAGAVWLFYREKGLQRRERRAKGEENAWAVRFVLVNAQRDAAMTVAELVDEKILEYENPIRHWLLRSKNSQNILQVFAQRTDHIHPALNQLASNGVLLLRQMDIYLDKTAEFLERGERPSVEVATKVAGYENALMLLVEELDARMRGVLKELNDHNDVLPVRGFEVWELPKK
jgi:hypothetical protein